MKKIYTEYLHQIIIRIFLPSFLVCLLSTSLYAQDDLIKGLLETADILNETMLEITALSDEEEVAIGNSLEKEISEDLKFTEEKKFNIKNIFNKLMPYISRKNINYGYRIVKTDDVNAYAIAGGRIFINTGIINFLETEDEMAFVLAHEIAHNELRHCIKRVQYAAIAESIDPNLGEIVEVAYEIYQMPFTKYDEFEADELGVRLMKQAGYDKEGAILFFIKLENLEKEYGIDNRDAVNDFISSHPTAKDRRERVKAM